jgi:hypothetical protein
MTSAAGFLPRIPGKTGVLLDVSRAMFEKGKGDKDMLLVDRGAFLCALLRSTCVAMEVATYSDEVQLLRHPHPFGDALMTSLIESQDHEGANLAQAVTLLTQAFPDLDRLVVVSNEAAREGFAAPLHLETALVNVGAYAPGGTWMGRISLLSGYSGGVVRWLAQNAVARVD